MLLLEFCFVGFVFRSACFAWWHCLAELDREAKKKLEPKHSEINEFDLGHHSSGISLEFFGIPGFRLEFTGGDCSFKILVFVCVFFQDFCEFSWIFQRFV